jgi:glycosyltransferase involved in cell wall biosynthesis
VTKEGFESQLTIAVTVFDRREYLEQAIASALAQTVPVKVIVVEDCGPDFQVRRLVEETFGSRVSYYRNAQRRGLFDNWNACIEACETRYLSILHDDDFLHPGFAAAMSELEHHAPACGLYFGQTSAVNESGRVLRQEYPTISAPWRRVALGDFSRSHVRSFAGQMFPIAAAKAVGGFRPGSLYCGDVEMWVNLTARYGAAQINRTVAYVRHHRGWSRGTSRAERSGRLHGVLCVQQKRTLARMREQGQVVFFDRRDMLTHWPISIKSLIRSAYLFSPRLLDYNYRLLIESRAPNWRYALGQTLAKVGGPCLLRLFSRAWRLPYRLLQWF